VLAPLPGAPAPTGDLSRTLTSVVGAACLRAEGGVGPQLTSHVFGLLKARDWAGAGAGAGAGEGEGALDDADRWLSSDEGAEWVVRTTDTIVDAVRDAPQERAKL
jgi:hypothetical protein